MRAIVEEGHPKSHNRGPPGQLDWVQSLLLNMSSNYGLSDWVQLLKTCDLMITCSERRPASCRLGGSGKRAKESQAAPGNDQPYTYLILLFSKQKEMAIVRILRGRTIFQVSICSFNNIFCNDLHILIFKLPEPDCCTVRMLEFHTLKNGACKLKTDLIYEGVNYICFTLDTFV